MRAVAIVVAAGRGARLISAEGPKQYMLLGGHTLLARAVAPFLDHAEIGHVLVVIHPDDIELYRTSLSGVASDKLLDPVTGGATRQQSVRAGLLAIAALGEDGVRPNPIRPEVVLIHDAARPFVSTANIDDVLAALAQNSAAMVAVPVVDTLKRGTGEPVMISETVSRENLWRGQTPQAFRFADILAAHDQAAESGRDDFTDDASIVEAAGMTVALVPGSEKNFKVTTLDDLARGQREVAGLVEFRTGNGFDVHKFAPGDHVWLCGVKVAHEATLAGHSDADVAMHALTDAIYGAIADGDIGAHFPPSDPQWKGARSHIFLEHARDRVAVRGGAIVHVDVTIICEAPKIGPHRDVMRARLAEILGLDMERVAVKATTTETLGFPGRREGIAAMASATVRLGT